MKCDDLLARELEQVLEMCRTAGWDVELEYTSPPRGEPSGKYRVVRCRERTGNKFLLTVAREVSGKEV